MNVSKLFYCRASCECDKMAPEFGAKRCRHGGAVFGSFGFGKNKLKSTLSLRDNVVVKVIASVSGVMRSLASRRKQLFSFQFIRIFTAD